MLLISDLELIKLIEIKNFADFADRGDFVSGEKVLPQCIRIHSIIDTKGERWKELRTILTPTFSSSKMKQMMPLMSEAIETLFDNIKINAEKNKTFDIYNMYARLTMDVIGRTAFGIRTDVQKNQSDLFFLHCKAMFQNPLDLFSIRMKICFPELMIFADRITVIQDMINKIREKPSGRGLLSMVSEVIKIRRKDATTKRQDLLQLMIDANMSVQDVKSTKNDNLMISEDSESEAISSSTSKGLKRYMTDEEIKANAIIFLLAGYETTSSALSFITYLLATHQDVQEKLRNEINEVVEDETKLDYNAISKMKFLDQVISESLRLYSPSVTFVTRTTNRDIEYKDYIIPKGLGIQVALWSLHHNPEYWPEPEKFMPERFSSENKSKIQPMSYQPFGSGPRNCIGMRFAQLEIKMAIARIIKSYKLITEEKELKIAYSFGTSHPKHGIKIKAVPV
ncbi:cytochrome P450 3A7-like isoform X2 [Centruroides vittatus]